MFFDLISYVHIAHSSQLIKSKIKTITPGKCTERNKSSYFWIIDKLLWKTRLFFHRLLSEFSRHLIQYVSVCAALYARNCCKASWHSNDANEEAIGKRIEQIQMTWIFINCMGARGHPPDALFIVYTNNVKRQDINRFFFCNFYHIFQWVTVFCAQSSWLKLTKSFNNVCLHCHTRKHFKFTFQFRRRSMCVYVIFVLSLRVSWQLFSSFNQLYVDEDILSVSSDSYCSVS